MKHAHFLRKLNDQRIITAIRDSEAKTSGEIRVYVSRGRVGDPVKVAKARFVRMRMNRTRQRNGVLLFIAPASQTFAIIGDEAVHARCGDAFWQSVSEEMKQHFQSDNMTDAIVHGITKAGVLLAEHFPRRSDDRNELPDGVERGNDSA